MNFSFEGNFRPKRNINLGGVKKIDDKRSLLAKAQSERKAREQERLKLKSAQQIQSFFRGRQQASLTKQALRHDFDQLLSSTTANGMDMQTWMTLTRQLIWFYQPNNEADNHHVNQYIAQAAPIMRSMFSIVDRDVQDTCLWLCCLLIKRVLLPSMDKGLASASQLLASLLDPATYTNQDYRIRIMTFCLYNTTLLKSMRHIKDSNLIPNMESILIQLATFYEPYYYATSLLVEKYQRKPNTPYMTRPKLLHMLTTELLVEPFFLDHISQQTLTTLALKLPLRDILKTVMELFLEPAATTLDDTAVAGLLMNLTVLSDAESGKHLEGGLTNYAEAIQLLLARLPVSYLTDPSEQENTDTIDMDMESSDEEDEDEERDVTMKEATTSSIATTASVSPMIRTRLETLYDSERINHLLYQFMHIGTNSDAIQSVSSFFNTLMLRWPMKKDAILHTLLYKSSNTHNLLQLLWQSWSASTEAAFFNNDGNMMAHLADAVKYVSDSKKASCESWSVLFLLCEVYARSLLTLGDDEFLDKKATHANPLQLNQVIDLGRQLKNISFVMFWRANSMDLSQPIGFTGIQLNQLRSSVTHLLQQIHMRDSRRNFCPQDHWLIPDLDTDNFSTEAVAEEFNLESEQQQEKNTPLRPLRMLSKGRLAVISPRLGLLNNIPFVIPFEQRVEIFRMFVNNDKKRNNVDEFYSRPKAAATVRRDHMFEDGFDQLGSLGVELKNKVAISFVDEFGLEEAGIDGGGVFKEFLTGLSKEAFNVNYGLFTATPEQLLYPNPSFYATEPQQLEYFKFLGLIIGKAVYEGILLDVAFAEFFLKKCLGKVNYLDDLSSLDPELYKGLLAVKNYDGNVEDLSLDFTSTHMENGRSVSVDLIPGGSNIPVTNQNRIQYIYSIANYRLNVQIAKQCRAFFRGLSTIVDIKWLRMFNQQELQIVLGGASVPIDLHDLRSHTVLAGFMEHDATVKNFWTALESFDNTLRMKFVKFVTSCSRPPLLGFKELVPQFCLRNAGADQERLPTSSTCVNLLKLPNYPTYEILREKLLYAITADAGFDLS
ncbi:ubiquitin-protein ligase (E3) [Mucor circinelloides]